jgi:hypothetical protein
MRQFRVFVLGGWHAVAYEASRDSACLGAHVGRRLRKRSRVCRPASQRRTKAIAANLDAPWGIAFLPDGSALIAERDSGAIQHMTQPGVVNSVGSVAGVAARGEGGLLGLATSGQTVFAYLTTAADNRVVTMRFDGASLTEPSPVLTGIPAGSVHDGGRIAFGPDGKLYVTTGESGDPGLAQDRSSLGGKILRINPDGSIPPDNPDPASPVWSFGHRNIQGLAWDSAGRLWVTDRSGPTAHWPIRHRCSSDSTGDCAPWWPHRMAHCGSPPATATVAEAPATATTRSCSSGPKPASEQVMVDDRHRAGPPRCAPMIFGPTAPFIGTFLIDRKQRGSAQRGERVDDRRLC